MVLAKKLLFILTYLPEVHSHTCPLVRGKHILQKILENTPYTGIYDEFPKEEKENESSPEPKEKEYATESNFFFQILPIIWLPLLDKKREF
jgi:hypothetical protein